MTTTRNPLWLIGGMLVAGAILTVTGITVASGAPDTPGQSDGPSAVVASRTPVVTKIPDVVAGAAEPDRTAADTPAPVVEPPPSPAVPPDAGQSAPEAGHSLAAPGPTPRPTRAPSVTCWDGSSTSAAAACPLPVGRTGLASVFPSLDSSCLRARHATVPGKNEVFECDYGTFVVRYSRWDVGADRLAYYRQANPGATELPWNAAGQPAGRQWWSFEEGPETLKRPWSATYADHPFSVSVEGIDQAARVDGVQLVRRVAPHLVGLARRNG